MTYVLDTNILFHAIERKDEAKAAIARDLLEHSVVSRGNLPRQVLGELLNVGHKRGRPMLDNARIVAERLNGSLTILDTSASIMWSASELASRYKLQYFDAVICTVAKAGRASVLFTEDMHDGLRVGSLTIVNPFVATNATLVSTALDR